MALNVMQSLQHVLLVYGHGMRCELLVGPARTVQAYLKRAWREARLPRFKVGFNPVFTNQIDGNPFAPWLVRLCVQSCGFLSLALDWPQGLFHKPTIVLGGSIWHISSFRCLNSLPIKQLPVEDTRSTLDSKSPSSCSPTTTPMHHLQEVLIGYCRIALRLGTVQAMGPVAMAELQELVMHDLTARDFTWCVVCRRYRFLPPGALTLALTTSIPKIVAVRCRLVCRLHNKRVCPTCAAAHICVHRCLAPGMRSCSCIGYQLPTCPTTHLPPRAGTSRAGSQAPPSRATMPPLQPSPATSPTTASCNTSANAPRRRPRPQPHQQRLARRAAAARTTMAGRSFLSCPKRGAG